MSPPGGTARSGSYEYATASRCSGRIAASSRHHRADCSGSSQVENAVEGLPCLRREKRSSSAAATTEPSTTSAAAESWNTALIPRTFISSLLGLCRWEFVSATDRHDPEPILRELKNRFPALRVCKHRLSTVASGVLCPAFTRQATV